MPKAKNTTWTARSLREHLGIEVRDWARILGINVRTVERWDSGEREPAGLAAEVFRGIGKAVDGGAPPSEIRQRLMLGLGAFLFHGLTSRHG